MDDRWEEIQKTLKELEQQHDLEILFACESGSRAWGFPSQDSDFDVRFIYRRSAEQYLSIFKRSDVVQQTITDDLDVSGWDLSKTLSLLYKSNTTVFEWLQSPIVYAEQENFTSAFEALLPAYFQPRALAFHYLGLAANEWNSVAGKDKVRYKKYFYILRSLLAYRWIASRQSIPPITWAALSADADLSSEFLSVTDQWLAEKAEGTERAAAARNPLIDHFIQENLDTGIATTNTFPKHQGDGLALDTFFRNQIIS